MTEPRPGPHLYSTHAALSLLWGYCVSLTRLSINAVKVRSALRLYVYPNLYARVICRSNAPDPGADEYDSIIRRVRRTNFSACVNISCLLVRQT